MLRTTNYYFSSHGTYLYEAKDGRVWVRIEDQTGDPTLRLEQQTRLRPEAFLRALKDAGLDGLWEADDQNCAPEFEFIREVGFLTIEWYDASGYRFRKAPAPWGDHCDTPYQKAFRALVSVLNELHALPPQ